MQTNCTLFNPLFFLYITVATNPVSPYGAFNGQVRSCVYQPTEIALIAKGLTKVSVWPTSDCSPFAWVKCPCISADGARKHNDPSGQNSIFESGKQRLSASLGWTGIVLRTLTLRKAKVDVCHCVNKAPLGPVFSPVFSTDCFSLYIDKGYESPSRIGRI